MEHSQFADFFFVNASRIQNVIFTLEGDFSVARYLEAVIFGFLVSFSAVYSSFDIQ